MRHIWKIYAREPDDSGNPVDYAKDCYQCGVIAVGWNSTGSLDKFNSREELKSQLSITHKKSIRGKKKRLDSWVGSLWNFKKSVQPSDIVICPDKKSGLFYIGRVPSDFEEARYYYDASPLHDRCEFAHRRKIEWFHVMRRNEMQTIWGTGRIGGVQTVSKVQSEPRKFRIYLRHHAIQKPHNKQKRVPWPPDKEWGRLAEQRAMKWLGPNAKNVASKCLGWDIECGAYKYEVKGRKSVSTTVRLTKNEWKAAKKYKKKYTLLLFTASTKEELSKAEPREITNPTQTEKWNIRLIREYLLNE